MGYIKKLAFSLLSTGINDKQYRVVNWRNVLIYNSGPLILFVALLCSSHSSDLTLYFLSKRNPLANTYQIQTNIDECYNFMKLFELPKN